MSPHLKYALITLFILLDACIVVYFFTDTFSPLIKQAAVQQPVSPQPVSQPPQQIVVNQPPVQQPRMPVTPQPAPQPIPTPSPAPAANTQALDNCNAQTRQYQKVFAVDWPRDLALSRGHRPEDDVRAGLKQDEYKAARREWDSIVKSCSPVPGWINTVKQEIVELAMRQDCDARAKGGYIIRSQWPEIAERLGISPNTKEARKKYLVEQNQHLADLVAKCTNLVTGWSLGWDKDELIAQAWKKEN